MNSNKNKCDNWSEFRRQMMDPENIVVIDITKLRLDAMDCGCQVNCEDLAETFEAAGAEVKGTDDMVDGVKMIKMYINNLSTDYVIFILDNFICDSDCECLGAAEDYIIDEDENDFPDWEDVPGTNFNDLNDDYNEDWDDNNLLENEKIEDHLDDEYDFPAWDDVNVNDIRSGKFTYDQLAERADKAVDAYMVAMRDFNEPIEEYLSQEDIDQMVELITDKSTIDDDTYQRLVNAIMDRYAYAYANLDQDINEKRKSCCPPKKAINESIDIVLNDISKKNNTISAKVQKALKENRTYLYENVKVGGRYFKDLTTRELKSMARALRKDKEALTESLSNNINESAAYNTAKDQLNLKNKLLGYIDEELTYRETRISCIKRLNEDGKISNDELENLFGPGQGGDGSDESEKHNEEDTKGKETDKAENTEDTATEEVELARIEITLKTADAALDLKHACLDADIPEKALELVGVEDEAFEKEESDEESEESTEEKPESEENSEEKSEEESKEEKNESIHYTNIAKLFEDEETPEEGAENKEENDENADEEKSEEDKEDEEKEEFKVILIDTDYTAKLAQVLNDLYGITKEEFEEMIGGTIIEEDSEKEDVENSDSEEKTDSKEKKEETSDSDEDIDPAELFKGL